MSLPREILVSSGGGAFESKSSAEWIGRLRRGESEAEDKTDENGGKRLH
jgi:hypothetical protein